jgi:hypothetical protein
MRLTLLEGRLDVLRELAVIEHDLAAIEREHGPTAEAEDVRRRLYVARLAVLSQLAEPLDESGTIH